MGIELDVLVGHPEHDLLFVAVQVARAAGLKNPSVAVANFHNQTVGRKLQVKDLPSLPNILRDARTTPSNTWLFDEARVYVMLMRGSTGQAEAFQRWLAEEVLPTIRKTGKYDAAESQNPIAQGVMDELKALRGEVVELKEIIRELIQRPQQEALALPAPVSPYEGDRKATLSA